MPDHLMPPGKRYHNAIVIETEANGSGRVIQVIGAIGQSGGMTFESKRGRKPDESDSFHRQHYLGTITTGYLDSVIKFIQTRCPPPPQQRNFNTQTYKTEQCKPDGSFYQPGEPLPPYEKCTEWTLNKAIPALQQSGYLDMSPPPQATEWTWNPATKEHWRWVFVDNDWKTEKQSMHQQAQKTTDWTWDAERQQYGRYSLVGNEWKTEWQ
jgi:hypothetical protein